MDFTLIPVFAGIHVRAAVGRYGGRIHNGYLSSCSQMNFMIFTVGVVTHSVPGMGIRLWPES